MLNNLNNFSCWKMKNYKFINLFWPFLTKTEIPKKTEITPKKI